MENDKRFRRLESNYELLRTELAQVKRVATEHQRASDELDTLRLAELRKLETEVEQLRIENARLHEELEQMEARK